ncbi:hypothetical protein [Polymorphospora sp. NPDC050346]|uniref:hypothetical protein n=1 Tax=Polymorphospora sp. NPDC050346 TaxID=3155780 RepID=UPI00340A0516
MENYRLTDERLAWLAVRAEVARRSKRRGILGWIDALTHRDSLQNLAYSGPDSGRVTVVSDDERHERMNDTMADYAGAVDEVARRMTQEQRRMLRATGAVPAGFMDEVEKERRRWT